MNVHEPGTGRATDAFAFGRNWQRYVERYLDPERVQIASESLADLVGSDLEGKVFLDVGAGSGLFSLCACLAGAARVVSIDVDPDSVESCLKLRSSVGDPETWEVLEGSILDSAFISKLPRGDVVYAWGVLHHTGDMYAALRNVARLVEPHGLLCIAIYNRGKQRFLNSERWWKIKRAYNHSPRFAQRAMEIAYLAYWVAGRLYRRKNPLRAAAEHKRKRGMAVMTDAVDWLGGFPYEYATVDEIVSFCRAECGLRELKVIPTSPHGMGNNEFVFVRASAS
jgi:SAM-dependent methyltransferase